MTDADAPSQAPAAAEIGTAGVWMTRGLALILAAYALFSCWTLLYKVSPIAIVTAGVFGVAAVGLWRMRPWSRWIVYSISAVLCVWFGWYVAKLVEGGWPYDYGTRSDDTRSVIAALPAVLLLLGGLAAAAHVRSVFKPR